MNGTIDHRRDRNMPWRARYLAPNGKQPSRSFTTRRDAERWLRGEIKKIDDQEWTDPTGGSICYAEHAQEWLDGLVGLKGRRYSGMSVYCGRGFSRVSASIDCARSNGERCARGSRRWILKDSRRRESGRPTRCFARASIRPCRTGSSPAIRRQACAYRVCKGATCWS